MNSDGLISSSTSDEQAALPSPPPLAPTEQPSGNKTLENKKNTQHNESNRAENSAITHSHPLIKTSANNQKVVSLKLPDSDSIASSNTDVENTEENSTEERDVVLPPLVSNSPPLPDKASETENSNRTNSPPLQQRRSSVITAASSANSRTGLLPVDPNAVNLRLPDANSTASSDTDIEAAEENDENEVTSEVDSSLWWQRLLRYLLSFTLLISSGFLAYEGAKAALSPGEPGEEDWRGVYQKSLQWAALFLLPSGLLFDFGMAVGKTRYQRLIQQYKNYTISIQYILVILLTDTLTSKRDRISKQTIPYRFIWASIIIGDFIGLIARKYSYLAKNKCKNLSSANNQIYSLPLLKEHPVIQDLLSRHYSFKNYLSLRWWFIYAGIIMGLTIPMALSLEEEMNSGWGGYFHVMLSNIGWGFSGFLVGDIAENWIQRPANQYLSLSHKLIFHLYGFFAQSTLLQAGDFYWVRPLMLSLGGMLVGFNSARSQRNLLYQLNAIFHQSTQLRECFDNDSHLEHFSQLFYNQFKTDLSESRLTKIIRYSLYIFGTIGPIPVLFSLKKKIYIIEYCLVSASLMLNYWLTRKYFTFPKETKKLTTFHMHLTNPIVMAFFMIAFYRTTPEKFSQIDVDNLDENLYHFYNTPYYLLWGAIMSQFLALIIEKKQLYIPFDPVRLESLTNALKNTDPSNAAPEITLTLDEAKLIQYLPTIYQSVPNRETRQAVENQASDEESTTLSQTRHSAHFFNNLFNNLKIIKEEGFLGSHIGTIRAGSATAIMGAAIPAPGPTMNRIFDFS